MKISSSFPPNWEQIQKRFNVEWKGLFVTYGDTVYTGEPMTPDLEVHESVHIRQQAEYDGGAPAWWERYLIDDDFRFRQELEAYRAQYRWYKENIRDRATVFKNLCTISSHLASPIYGGICDRGEALRFIEN